MADEKKYIEVGEAIKEILRTYECEFPTASGAFDEFAVRIVPNVLKYLPTVDVLSAQDVSDAVDEALRILNAIHSSGRLDYGDYCDIYDAISAIYGGTMQNESEVHTE